MLVRAMVFTMTDRIEMVLNYTTTMMARFTIIREVGTVFIITFRKTSEHIMRNAIAYTMKCIIENILSPGTDIRATLAYLQERKSGRSEM